jgi:hypothetical protein
MSYICWPTRSTFKQSGGFQLDVVLEVHKSYVSWTALYGVSVVYASIKHIFKLNIAPTPIKNLAKFDI